MNFFKLFWKILLGEFFTFYGGGSGGGQNTTIEKADPWAGQQPHLLDIFKEAQRQYNQPGPSYYPGSTVAAPSAATSQGQHYLLNYAAGAAPQLAGASANTAMFDLGAGRDVGTNPYLQSAIQAAMNPVVTRFTEAGGPLSQIRSGFSDTSGGVSTRQGIAEGIALRGLGQQLSDISSGMTWQGYEQAQEQALRTQALLPQITAAGAYPGQLFSAVGQQRDAYSQALIDEAINRWNFEQNLPAQKLGQYQSIVQGTYGGSRTMDSTTAAGRVNPVLAAAGGAATGYALGGMIGGATQGSTFGPYGAVAGALIGLLAS